MGSGIKRVGLGIEGAGSRIIEAGLGSLEWDQGSGWDPRSHAQL